MPLLLSGVFGDRSPVQHTLASQTNCCDFESGYACSHSLECIRSPAQQKVIILPSCLCACPPSVDKFCLSCDAFAVCPVSWRDHHVHHHVRTHPVSTCTLHIGVAKNKRMLGEVRLFFGRAFKRPFQLLCEDRKLWQ